MTVGRAARRVEDVYVFWPIRGLDKGANHIQLIAARLTLPLDKEYRISHA